MFSLEAALIQFWIAQDRIYWGWGKAGGSRLLLFNEKRVCPLLVAAGVYYEVCWQKCMVEVTLIRTLKAQTRKKTDGGFKWNPRRSREERRIPMKRSTAPAAVCALHTPSFPIRVMTTATAAPSEQPENKRSTSRQPSEKSKPFVLCRLRGDTEKELHRLQQRKLVKPKVTRPPWARGPSAGRDRKAVQSVLQMSTF